MKYVQEVGGASFKHVNAKLCDEIRAGSGRGGGFEKEIILKINF